MTPVTNAWRDAIDSALEANRQAGRQPTTAYGLGVAIWKAGGDERRTKESWIREVRRIRGENRRVSENLAVRIAAGLGVPLETLPQPSKRDTITSLRAAVEEERALRIRAERAAAADRQRADELAEKLRRTVESQRAPQELPKPGSRRHANG